MSKVFKTWLFILLSMSSYCFAERAPLELKDPTITYIVQGKFAFFTITNLPEKKGRLRIFNLNPNVYFFKNHKKNWVGFYEVEDFARLWTSPNQPFYKNSPSAILVYYISSVTGPHSEDEYSEIPVLLDHPIFNSITNSISFEIQILTDEIPPPAGELIEVTLFID